MRDMVKLNGIELTPAAHDVAAWAGVDPAADVARVRAGLARMALLVECLDGANDPATAAAWEEYVDAIYSAAEREIVRYQIQFRGNWGGFSTLSWRPAITGTINQTDTPDEEASTFDTYVEAETVLDNTIRPQAEGLDHVQFRVVEVQS